MTKQQRILAAIILGLAVFLLTRIISWQQGEVDEAKKCKAILAEVMDENEELKARVVELLESQRDGGVDGGDE